jgi:hypothetical protein
MRRACRCTILRYQLIEYVMKPVIPDRSLSHQVMDRERDRLDSTVMVVNLTGAFLWEASDRVVE